MRNALSAGLSNFKAFCQSRALAWLIAGRPLPQNLPKPPLHPPQQAVKVNALGKWKTALQMTAMSMLLFCRDERVVPSLWTGEALPACQRLRLCRLTSACLWGPLVYRPAGKRSQPQRLSPWRHGDLRTNDPPPLPSQGCA